ASARHVGGSRGTVDAGGRSGARSDQRRLKPSTMTVNLTRIYTRLGDSGETHLGDMSRVSKTHPRIEAYGTVDELSAHIGVALATDGLSDNYADWLRRIQNDLFDLGADVSVPLDET